ncbi:hypothetical protein L6164_014175 [Bauhinia variegata]|uniref:Uncharacterized protein n=1 Tax=Bauhinia variegata TaxID=167791 RepID=A0ACB9NHX9_BAUVA|nr:hypothetical protein L6164_014175 [Bauhinia variegata]
MEFKFRAGDERPPSFLPPSSTISSLSYRALTAGYSSLVPTPFTSQMWTPNNAHEAIVRELEKEQIRREIIAAEIVRRQMLEEEVRRELMLERQLAMRKNMGEEFSLEEQIAMRFCPSFPMTHPLKNLPLEERIAFPFPCSSTMNMFALPQVPQVMAPEIKPSPETKKDKLIILAKPDPDHFRAKRKTIESPAVDDSERSPFGLKKKPKGKWSCALCQVSASSEKVINEHLQGRKHKAKESGLRNDKIGLEAKADGQLLQSEVVLKDTTKNVDDKDLVEIKNEEQPLLEKQDSEGPGVKRPDELERKKKFKFWCEICQVGTHCQIVMESHRKGRKHIARMLTFSESKGIVLVSSTVSSEATQSAKDTDTVNVLTKQTDGGQFCKYR